MTSRSLRKLNPALATDIRRTEVLDDGYPPARAVRETSRYPQPTGGRGRPSTRRITSVVDLAREYVAVGGFGAVSSYARTLPAYVDDVTQRFGYDLYRRMRHDSQVESALSTLIMATQAQGLHMGPNIDKGEPGYDDSKSISDFCIKNVERMERPMSDIFYEMGLGTAYGYKASEQTYEPVNWSSWGRPLMAIKHLRTKPQDAISFVVDPYNNVLGFTPSHRVGSLLSAGPMLSSSLFEGDDPLVIPRSKFWVFSFLPENGDPRGTSLLRSAYHPWWVKGQVWKAYLQYLATFAQPSVVGFVSANREPEYLLDANGNPLITHTPQEIMVAALEKIQNGAVGAFANDERVEILQPSGKGEPFQLAISISNRELTKAIIRQTLTTDEGEHMARAASEVHQDVFGLLVRHLKASLVGSFLRDVIRPLVWYNFGEQAVIDYLPTCTLGETEHQDFSGDATAIANLLRVNFFSKSQYRGLDDYLSLPPRDPEVWEQEIAQTEALAQAAVEKASAPDGESKTPPAKQGSQAQGKEDSA